MCAWAPTSLLMTRPRVLSERLMEDASLSRSPSDSATFCLSLPVQTANLSGAQPSPKYMLHAAGTPQPQSFWRARVRMWACARARVCVCVCVCVHVRACPAAHQRGAQARHASPARSTRCRRDVRTAVTPSSNVLDSTTQVNTQWDRED
jgi:hypothetical protein